MPCFQNQQQQQQKTVHLICHWWFVWLITVDPLNKTMLTTLEADKARLVSARVIHSTWMTGCYIKEPLNLDLWYFLNILNELLGIRHNLVFFSAISFSPCEVAIKFSWIVQYLIIYSNYYRYWWIWNSTYEYFGGGSRKMFAKIM